MERDIAGAVLGAAVDGALVGTAGGRKEPASGKRAHQVMERVMNAIFFICGMIAVAFVLLISVYLVISGLPAIRAVMRS